MPSRLLVLTFDAHDPARLSGFWTGVMGRVVVDDLSGALLPGSDTQVDLRFTPSGAEKVGLNRVHLHLTSTSPAGQQDTVAAALELGADHLDVGQVPEEGQVVLADLEGDEYRVIVRGISVLAGCGFLGELACDGTRQVGLLWAEALGWPLVWDEDEETAVQLPHGGTKVAWGGPPMAPKHGRNRQRLDLTLLDGDLSAEVDDLSRWARPGSAAPQTVPSSWPTQTATFLPRARLTSVKSSPSAAAPGSVGGSPAGRARSVA